MINLYSPCKLKFLLIFVVEPMTSVIYNQQVLWVVILHEHTQNGMLQFSRCFIQPKLNGFGGEVESLLKNIAKLRNLEKLLECVGLQLAVTDVSYLLADLQLVNFVIPLDEQNESLLVSVVNAKVL